MRGVVAIEPGLMPVETALVRGGYQVIPLEQAGSREVDAVVVRGTDNNLAGQQAIVYRGPVIEASGLTPEEVRRRVDERVRTGWPGTRQSPD